MLQSLVIDDEHVSRNMAMSMLRKVGTNVHYAENGLEGIEMCKKQMPDIVIVDWMMPLMNGIEFIQELQMLPDHEQVKVVMCSSKFNEEDIAKSIAQGADEYLKKPLHINDLYRIIEHLNDGRYGDVI
tara:strand:+ start:637 stop:1020 length:384 start_codon:yes stop_codon:yes gene_type:complete